MKSGGPRLVSVLAACLLGLSACEQDATFSTTPAGAPDSWSPQQRQAVFAVMGLTSADEDQVINACDEAITPTIHSVPLGGTLGTALLVVLTGGEEAPSCYGMTGVEITLLQQDGATFRIVFEDRGQLAVLPTAHNGVRDIAVGGPGFEFPVYHWNGMEFVAAGTIPDTEFPIPIN